MRFFVLRQRLKFVHQLHTTWLRLLDDYPALHQVFHAEVHQDVVFRTGGRPSSAHRCFLAKLILDYFLNSHVM